MNTKEQADEVMAALSGILNPCDKSGRRIQPGDWAIRAVGGRGAVSLGFCRVYPADKLTKAREAHRAAHGSATLHLILYFAHSRVGWRRQRISKTTAEGDKLCVIDMSIVPPDQQALLDQDRAALDATIRAQNTPVVHSDTI